MIKFLLSTDHFKAIGFFIVLCGRDPTEGNYEKHKDQKTVTTTIGDANDRNQYLSPTTDHNR